MSKTFQKIFIFGGNSYHQAEVLDGKEGGRRFNNYRCDSVWTSYSDFANRYPADSLPAVWRGRSIPESLFTAGLSDRHGLGNQSVLSHRQFIRSVSKRRWVLQLLRHWYARSLHQMGDFKPWKYRTLCNYASVLKNFMQTIDNLNELNWWWSLLTKSPGIQYDLTVPPQIYNMICPAWIKIAADSAIKVKLWHYALPTATFGS